MVGGLAGICRVVFGTRWSGPAACAWLNRFRVEMPARSQRCQRFMRPQIVAKSVQKSKLVMHGEDDQIVPVKDSAKKSARLIKGAKEIYYPGAPHGLTATLQDRVNSDLLAFLEQEQQVLKKAA